MLRWFFEKRDENLWPLFEDLHVARAGEQYRAHFQKYPVIFVSFKGTKANTWEECRQKIRKVVREMFEVHQASFEGRLSEYHERDYRAVLDGTADDVAYQQGLYTLTKYLHQVHGKRPSRWIPRGTGFRVQKSSSSVLSVHRTIVAWQFEALS